MKTIYDCMEEEEAKQTRRLAMGCQCEMDCDGEGGLRLLKCDLCTELDEEEI